MMAKEFEYTLQRFYFSELISRNYVVSLFVSTLIRHKSTEYQFANLLALVGTKLLLNVLLAKKKLYVHI